MNISISENSTVNGVHRHSLQLVLSAMWRPLNIVHTDYFENEIPLKPVLKRTCSIANYIVAYANLIKPNTSRFSFFCVLCFKRHPFRFLFQTYKIQHYPFLTGVVILEQLFYWCIQAGNTYKLIIS